MKKVVDFLKANALLFVGILMFLIYVNFFASKDGEGITLAVIGTLISIYFIVIGIIEIVIGNKLKDTARNVFDVISICLFTLFMFIYSIFSLATLVELNKNEYFTVGPTAWLIEIIALISSFILMGFYPVAKFVKNKAVKNLGFVFSTLFVAALILGLSFDSMGQPMGLGNVQFVYATLYVIFAVYLFASLVEKQKAPQMIETKEEVKEEAIEENAKEPEANEENEESASDEEKVEEAE